jgi:hypothetical protein
VPDGISSRDPAREGIALNLCGIGDVSFHRRIRLFQSVWKTKMTNLPAITKLDDARELKRAGLPVGMPIVRKEFSREYSEHWIPLMNAYTHFMIAMRKHSESPNPTISKWRKVKRALGLIGKEMDKCDAFVWQRFNSVEASEQDRFECQMMAGFLVDRALPFVAYWRSVVDSVDAGTELVIRPGDIPKWVDGET